MSLPKWECESPGRRRSAAAASASAPTATTRPMITVFQVMRHPSSRAMTTVNTGASVMIPPMSLPSTGAPSTDQDEQQERRTR